MKKLINKLFEKFGYVPKEYKKRCETLNWMINEHDSSILNSTNEYCVIQYKSGFLVTDYCKETETHRFVKFFYDSDFNYAQLCAEELCETLKQKC